MNTSATAPAISSIACHPHEQRTIKRTFSLIEFTGGSVQRTQFRFRKHEVDKFHVLRVVIINPKVSCVVSTYYLWVSSF